MSKTKFIKEYEVHYYEVNRYVEASLTTILNYLEDVAISHSKAAGYGVERLRAESIGWILRRWIVKMHRYPRLDEKITITTWPAEFKRFYANREFVIYDEEQKIIGEATSLWIYFNLDKKKPIRIPEHMSEEYKVGSFGSLGLSFNEIPDMHESEYEKYFSVRLADIDTNGHVNNARYVDWILESLPGELSDKCFLSSLEIEYIKETCYGDFVKSKCKKSIESQCEYIHKVELDKCGSVLASARTVWKNRE